MAFPGGGLDGMLELIACIALVTVLLKFLVPDILLVCVLVGAAVFLSKKKTIPEQPELLEPSSDHSPLHQLNTTHNKRSEPASPRLGCECGVVLPEKPELPEPNSDDSPSRQLNTTYDKRSDPASPRLGCECGVVLSEKPELPEPNSDDSPPHQLNTTYDKRSDPASPRLGCECGVVLPEKPELPEPNSDDSPPHQLNTTYDKRSDPASPHLGCECGVVLSEKPELPEPNSHDSPPHQLNTTYDKRSDPASPRLGCECGVVLLEKPELPEPNSDDSPPHQLNTTYDKRSDPASPRLGCECGVVLPEKPELPEPNSDDSPPHQLINTTHDNRSDSAPPRWGYEYDVFLSFRGADTRKGFTDCLFHSLRDAGIRVFRDNEELRPGEEIEIRLRQGIMHSKISIPIFSKDYADSKWCLRELEMIAESKKERKQIVMSVFFKVTPDQVKHQTGSYEEALRGHQNKYPESVEQWRSALSVVGRAKGWELTEIANGHEGHLIKLIVAEVLAKLKKDHLPVTKELVGIDKQAHAVMSLLDVGVEDVIIVGVYGFSGIGKTTLAKDVYNKLLSGCQFEGCSSLDNIRQKSPNGLACLQSKLVADLIRGERREFGSVDEGIKELTCRFREKKVLILLDDVDDISQLNALVAEHDWFGPGSRVIVTTTDGNLLKQARQVSAHYKVEAMDKDEALELFSRHAFSADPSADPSTAKLIPLAEQIVLATGRIPLALEIIGRCLWDRSEKEWKTMLENLAVRSHKEILDKLRISYDGLDPVYKEIFLDVACFLAGVDYRVAVHMWNDCSYSPGIGIKVLLQRCLIKIGEDNKLWMHDSLRKLGRDIVRNESKELGMRSRLWLSEDSRDVLEKKKGTKDIKAISLQSDHDRRTYTFNGDLHFKSMPNLRFLRLERTNLSGDFQSLSELRWLSWQRPSFKFTPNSLPSEKLIILDMSRSEVTNEWKGWNSIKKAVKLKVLDLSGCHKLAKTPDLSVFPNLERLILEDCKILDEVHGSVLDLPLKSLNLKNCSSIRKLPARLGFLQTLEELIIDGTLINKLPDSITALENLQRLSANNCRNLKALPSSIGQLDSLVHLSLSLTSIETLPGSIGNLSNLEMLDISSSEISHFPKALGKLEKLKEINASMCKNLKREIPVELGSLSSLKVLRLDGTNITSLPKTISGLSHLQTLDLTGCSGIQRLPELPVSLVRVRVTCKLVEAIPNLPLLIKLEELVLNIGTLQCEIGSLPRLKVLCIPSCPNLQSLPELPRSLQKLSISNSPLEMLPEFSNLENLSELSLENCDKLKEIPSLSSLVMLKSLKVSFFPLITSLTCPKRLESLRRLQVSSCEKLEKLPDLSNFKKLSAINVRGCQSLVGLLGLGSLHVLTNLDIGQCKSIEHLPNLSELTLLRSLSADGCKKLQKLEGVDALKDLLSLQISGCIRIKSLPDLSKLRKLNHLNIKDCKDIKELRGLLKLKSLQRIVISGEVKLAKLSDLVELSYSNTTGGDNASVVSQIIAEFRKRSLAPGGPMSAPGNPNFPFISPLAPGEPTSAPQNPSFTFISGLGISIRIYQKNKESILAISPWANAPDAISVP